MAGHTLPPLLQYLGALALVILMGGVHQGQAGCDIAAVEACLDTIYTSAAPCTEQSLADLDACFDTHLGNATCLVADMGNLPLNRTIVHGKCKETCTNPPTPTNPCAPRGTCKRNGDTWDYMCECDAGWTGPRCDEDVDECADNSLNDCGLHATCRNKRGTFSCICDSGYVFKKETRACVPYNGCQYNTLECEHICSSPSGVATCQCYPGFTMNGNQCTGVGTCNERNRKYCLDNGGHGCYKAHGGLDACFCRLGYTGNNGIQCTAIDRCEAVPCETTTCQSSEGLFQCGCSPGSELQEDKLTCIECDDNHYGEECVTVCDCGDNYARCGPTGCTDCKAGWTGTGCTESAEDAPCTANTNCGPDGTCVNLANGGYECQCNPGAIHLYGHPKAPCKAFNECEKAYDNDCEMTCHDTALGYECSCDEGYELAVDGYSCLNIDDCPPDHGCDICVDGLMAYTCACNEGFQLNEVDNTCFQIDDCETNDCQQVCEDKTLGYSCKCYPGYQLQPDGTTCEDIDDCVGNNCAGECDDGNSTFTCLCNAGYKLQFDGISCVDIDECMEKTHDCAQLCDNTIGSYTCSCQSGYNLHTDLKMCNEISPCDDHDCAHQCVRDSATEYHCVCDTGYVVSTTNPKACTDVDECADGDDECEDDCENTVGGYTCSCPDGQVLKSDQRTCRVLSLCETTTHGCAFKCEDDKCTCDTGYSLNTDGKTCDDVDECSTDTDNNCQQTCTDTDGSYTCGCNAGYKLNSDKKTCRDINECSTGSHNCEHGCDNTVGSFTCTCPSGSVLKQDGKTCKVSNFCAETDCAHSCTNNQCTCNTGYSLISDNINCEDIDECLGAVGCEGSCINTPGTYHCVCNGNNMVLGTDGKSCVESCNLDCGTGATCRVEDGEETCDCDQDGFSYISNACLDIDECADEASNECSEREVCNNSPGTYNCACKTGFEPSSADQQDCIDIDECQNGDHCVGSTHCINRIGSFLCPCDSYITDNTTIVIHMNMFGDEDDPDLILPPLKVLLTNNDVVQSYLDADEFHIYLCKFMALSQAPTRRLLQTERELSFALVTDEYLTNVQRADIVLSLMEQLSTPTNLTVGQDVVTMSDPAIVSKGKPVTIKDRCTYFDLTDYCGAGTVCNIVNTTTTCVPVPTAASTGLPHKTVIALATTAGLAGFIFLLLLAMGVFICKKQRDNNDYYRHQKGGSTLLPRGFDGASRSNSNPGTLHIDKTVQQDPGIRMQYQFYKDSVSRPTYTPAIHSGTMRGWSGTGSQGWAPSVGRQEAPNHSPPPLKEDSLRDVGMAQFDHDDDGDYNDLTGDQGPGGAVFQAS